MPVIINEFEVVPESPPPSPPNQSSPALPLTPLNPEDILWILERYEARLERLLAD
jgi:hypothetical protein